MNLHIGTSTAQQNTHYQLVHGGLNSDPDNVYLYAHNELIQVNGLKLLEG